MDLREQTELEREVADLIIETLNLESVLAADIDPDDYLFNEGLGLDSIDALELALAIKQSYGLDIKSGDESNAEIFSSLAALSRYISENKM
jgi:acyl carrier protein